MPICSNLIVVRLTILVLDFFIFFQTFVFHVTVIYLEAVLVLLPFAFLTVKVTVNLPFLVYVCEAFLVDKVTPSPKFQTQEVGDPLLLSVNVTFNGAFPDVGDPDKAAIGFCVDAVTFIKLGFVTVLLPAALVAVSATA